MLRQPAGTVTVAVLLVALASVAWSQGTVTRLQMRPIASVNGKDVYQAYCAYCHGDDLRGRGPGLGGTRMPTADLTTIALRNDGKFAAGDVEEKINRWKAVPRTMAEFNAHVAQPMPAFGPILAKLYPQEVRDRVIRLSNLVSYIKSKQVTSPWPDEPK